MANPASLRTAIDSGKTGDTVDYPDPAAAPLGTDEEAAGTPVPPDAVRHALDKELQIGAVARHYHRYRGSILLASALVLLLLLAAVMIGVSHSLQS